MTTSPEAREREDRLRGMLRASSHSTQALLLEQVFSANMEHVPKQYNTFINSDRTFEFIPYSLRCDVKPDAAAQEN